MLTRATTFVATTEAEKGIKTGKAEIVFDSLASGNQAIQFGQDPTSCNNFCSIPKKPIFKTSPVTIDANVNSGWCGPTWDAPQAEYDLAREKMGAGAILLPPCPVEAGFIEQTPEQIRISLDKAQVAGLQALVFPGYTCRDPYDHKCYLGLTNPDAAIDKFAYHPAMAGIYIVDEQLYQEFPAVAAAIKRVQERRPGLIAYSNLFGSFGYLEARPWLGSTPTNPNVTYDEYISEYIRTVKTTLLSVDDYTSPANMDFTLAVIERWAKHYQANGRPELTTRQLWSAISTIGGHAEHDLAYFQTNMPAFKAVNDKYKAKHLYFTWRVPPEGGRWLHRLTGPGLCGKFNHAKPGTVCGE